MLSIMLNFLVLNLNSSTYEFFMLGHLLKLFVPQFPQLQKGNDVISNNKSYSIYFGGLC